MGTLFVASALAMGLVASAGPGGDGFLASDTWEVGRRTTYELVVGYAMRMAAVFTIVTSTIMLRTRVTASWLVVAGYAVGIVLLLAVRTFAWVELAFPAWVFTLSVYILAVGSRRDRVAGAETRGRP